MDICVEFCGVCTMCNMAVGKCVYYVSCELEETVQLIQTNLLLYLVEA